MDILYIFADQPMFSKSIQPSSLLEFYNPQFDLNPALELYSATVTFPNKIILMLTLLFLYILSMETCDYRIKINILVTQIIWARII